jgi:hypothetical protein
MHQRNFEARSHNHCYRRKVICTTYSECMSVTLVIQHASARGYYIVTLQPVWLYHIFPHYQTKGTIIGRIKLLNIKYNYCLNYYTIIV